MRLGKFGFETENRVRIEFDVSISNFDDQALARIVGDFAGECFGLGDSVAVSIGDRILSDSLAV